MQSKEQSLSLLHRENYEIPKGEENFVHYKIAKLNAIGGFAEKPRLLKSGVKMFDSTMKSELELKGYEIEILHHPNGTYTNVYIEDTQTTIAKKDAEIEELRAQLAKIEAEKAEKAETKVEETEEKKNKGGRPRKEA